MNCRSIEPLSASPALNSGRALGHFLGRHAGEHGEVAEHDEPLNVVHPRPLLDAVDDLTTQRICVAPTRKAGGMPWSTTSSIERD